MATKMANRKSKLEIPDWAIAKYCMAEFARAQLEIQKAKALLDEATARAAATFRQQTAAEFKRSDELEKALLEFARVHPDDFVPARDGDGRTVEYAGARLRVRKQKDRVEIADVPAAVEYLDRWRPELVRREVYPDKVALLQAHKDGDADLRRSLQDHGIALEEGKDKFSLEVVETGKF